MLCHVCGRAFRSLGSHVRAHGLTAAQYREEFGLLRTRALSARALSQARSAAQRTAYASSPRMRADFSTGQTMARQGRLAAEARQSLARHGASDELVHERRARLDDGRRTQAAAAAARLQARVATLGYGDVGTAVRALYLDGEQSLEATARRLGIGSEQMRRLLGTVGIRARATGENSATGRRARVALNDLAAAERVGARDITAWLKERQADGATLAELAASTGRSIPWVTAGLRR
ncbi:MucR family transcriptional regulator [Kitasatospora sp. NPDC048540]|uniref:MucR family transcriptional regulator n=1 Tax=unclassified Kitasatospora TaxID=2633591 RepID=UPI000ADF4493|nr:MucR family transcriptional regulator [Kitasatospora sp. MBT63]